MVSLFDDELPDVVESGPEDDEEPLETFPELLTAWNNCCQAFRALPKKITTNTKFSNTRKNHIQRKGAL